MDKRNSMVSYKCLMFIFFVPLCTGDNCHRGLPNHITSGNSTWKLCVMNMNEETLRFKIKSLFSKRDTKSSRWLNIGFPQASPPKTDYIPFFLLEVNKTNSIVVKQTEEVKKEVNCSIPAKGTFKLISVDCVFGETVNKYVNSKKIKIFWNTGSGNKQANVVKEGQNLIKNHSSLNFYPHRDKDVPAENAGSTAMRLLLNYGKSMGVIFGISILLTALITLTICCCCKKTPVNFSKQKISKDSSVSFYKDDSEGDGRSDESENDEKVAFIRNNNERNSTV